ncbi:hypothetical protein P3X46_029963 [Hevea brasiliensis]|uniref:DUF4378 domain-containing protein n=1 Tax=Hevea brasiliensis TaxID=3981 RepID=A0ABQ9KVC2_HEVBR|nr:uncharacterized protein LOC110640222 [Hevea brasiliensis]KAJ9147847.1 hypothetical protein P3X46_029963 [Hevea brasiliensis]
MASIISSSNKKPFLIGKKPLMLKDYLRDDLSSCSSNGFKSFPRRQCCTTVRFLLEIDLNTNTKHQRRQFFKRSRSSSTTISAPHKASEAVINAVKLLSFPFSSSSSMKSSSPFLHNKSRKGGFLLPRSFSRKLLEKSFWMKADQKEREGSEKQRWRLFHEFLQERHEPFDHNINRNSTSRVTTAFTNSRLSSSSSRNSNSNSNSPSWTDSEFTGHSGNSESYNYINQNAAAEGLKGLPSEKIASKGVGVTAGQDSITVSVEKNTKEWPTEVVKEQFSPVSVLDCPYEDEEENSSASQRSLVRMEGAHQKFMAKIRRFESLAQVNPPNLENQMELAGLEDETLKSPVKVYSLSAHSNMFSDGKEEIRAHELLKLVKGPSNHRLISKADIVLLDFFREKIMENIPSVSMFEGYNKYLEKELEVAQDWINGHPQDMLLGWEVKDSRTVYVRDMERKRKWKNFDEEKQDLVLELELEVFTSLVNEAILDLLLPS